jgi:HAE1 family hydrophobic/amphiphilic exporter-1
LCAILLRPKKPAGSFNPFGWFEAGFNGLSWLYGGSVKLAIRIVPVTLVIFIASIVLALWSLSKVPGGFVPQEDEGWFLVNIQLPDAATLQRTRDVTSNIVEMLQEIPSIADIVMINGLSLIDNSRAGNAATAFVILKPWDERKPEEHLLRVLGEVNGRFSKIQEAFAIGFPPPSLPGIGFAGGFMMQIQDRAGIGPQELQRATSELVAAANGQTGLNRVFSTYRANTPQLYLDIDRDQVKSMGIPLQSVFDTLSAYLGSVYVNDFTLLGRTYQVLVQADSNYRAAPEDIRRLEMRTPSGDMIPLGTIMTVEETLGPRTVSHFNIYPSARLNGEAAIGFSSGQAMNLMANLCNQTLPQSMGFAWTDLSFQEQRASGGSTAIYVFAVIMVYLVLAAQYESWSIPFAVVLGVPAALLGAAIAVLLRGFDNNVYTQIGIVLLIGLAAKTAILIVEFARAERMDGKSIREAALTAARLRFRAVLMTAFSFILGVIPLVIATGAGAASRQVLGLVVFAGMLVSTMIGVIAVPALFYVIQGFSEWIWPVKKQPAADVQQAS